MRCIYVVLDEIINFYEEELIDLFLMKDLNNNNTPREEIERRMNIISYIEGGIALKIKLLNLTVLFGEFF